jgi:ubiquinone/menaquinone biosynthesis C-methylase UbiE
MLEQCRRKAIAKGYSKDQIDFRQLDAESIPFDNNSFDAIISGMMYGLVPNQQRVLSEMVRVLKPNGVVAISAHGPEYYYEAIDAAFRTIPLRYGFGYRIEFWPRSEEHLNICLPTPGIRIFEHAGSTGRIYSKMVVRHTISLPLHQRHGGSVNFHLRKLQKSPKEVVITLSGKTSQKSHKTSFLPTAANLELSHKN